MLTFQLRTPDKWIPCKARHATTYRIVVDYLTFGFYSARSRARIDALQIVTGLVLGTFGTNHAFGPTCGRSADITHIAGTNCVSVYFTALTVRAAWRWLTGVRSLGYNYS